MTTPDGDLTGTWMHPTGTRVEVTRQTDGWHTHVYLTRRGSIGQAADVFTDPATLRERLTNLETQGYVRLVPGMPEPARAASQTAGIWLIVAGVVIALICIAAALA